MSIKIGDRYNIYLPILWCLKKELNFSSKPYENPPLPELEAYKVGCIIE